MTLGYESREKFIKIFRKVWIIFQRKSRDVEWKLSDGHFILSHVSETYTMNIKWAIFIAIVDVIFRQSDNYTFDNKLQIRKSAASSSPNRSWLRILWRSLLINSAFEIIDGTLMKRERECLSMIFIAWIRGTMWGGGLWAWNSHSVIVTSSSTNLPRVGSSDMKPTTSTTWFSLHLNFGSYVWRIKIFSYLSRIGMMNDRFFFLFTVP